MTKTKLLIATDSFLPRWDGISRFLVEIVPKLSDDFDITVIAPDFKGELKKEKFGSAKIYTFPVSSFEVAGYNIPKPKFRELREHVRQSDIVWSQTIGPIGLFAMRYAAKENKPLISYIHSLEWELFSKVITKNEKVRSFIEYVTKRIAVRTYNRASLLAVPSESIGQLLNRQGISTKYSVVPMGVNTVVFRPGDKELAKKRLGLSGPVIGFSGRLSKEKNLDVLYKAFLELKETRFKNLNLLLIGDGPMASRYPKAIVTGFVNDVETYLNCLDIYVLPSLTETSSLSTMEAMSCELPCVVTRVGFLREYIKDGHNGFFFPRRSYHRLAEKLKILLAHPDIRKEVGINARNTIIRDYSWDFTADKLKDIFKKMMD